MIDLYKILDLELGVSQRKLFKRFVELAKKCHPDFDDSKEARQRFIDINIAYYILEDNHFRRDYDELYKSSIIKKTNNLSKQSTLVRLQKDRIENATIKANEYLTYDYKKFYRKIPKNQNVWDVVLEVVLDRVLDAI